MAEDRRSLPEAAKIAGLTVDALRKRAARGAVPHKRHGGRMSELPELDAPVPSAGRTLWRGATTGRVVCYGCRRWLWSLSVADGRKQTPPRPLTGLSRRGGALYLARVVQLCRFPDAQLVLRSDWLW